MHRTPFITLWGDFSEIPSRNHIFVGWVRPHETRWLAGLWSQLTITPEIKRQAKNISGIVNQFWSPWPAQPGTLHKETNSNVLLSGFDAEYFHTWWHFVTDLTQTCEEEFYLGKNNIVRKNRDFLPLGKLGKYNKLAWTVLGQPQVMDMLNFGERWAE